MTQKVPEKAGVKPGGWPGAGLGPALGCLLLILAFAIFFSLLAMQQHRAFQTNGLDLGNVDQALWNTAQGRFLHFTLMAPIESRLALHVEPVLLLLVPLYWLNLGGPELLLVVQASLVALGAWPLYQIARTTLSSPILNHPSLPFRLMPLIFPLAYLLLPALESAVLFDFHAVTLASTFLLFAFWALAQNKSGYFLIFSILAMACKEDMPLVVAMLGLYAGLARQRWRLASLTLGLSALWFVVAFFIIQPRFALAGNIQLDRYAWLGDNPLAMVQTILTRPGLVVGHLWNRVDLPGYLTNLFFPTAFLALLSPLTLLPMLPTLAVNLLSDNPFTWRLEDFHYGAPLTPFLFISAIYGIRRAGDWIGVRDTRRQGPQPARPLLIATLALLLLLFSALYHFYRGFTPLARPFMWPEVTAHHSRLAAYLRTLPAGTVLFTQSNLAPHLTQRRAVYTDFAYFTDPEFRAEPVDDIVLDVTGFENRGGLHQFLRRMLLDSGDYQLVAAQDGWLHLRPATAVQPAAAPASLPASFYTFIQPAGPPDYQLPVDFGDLVRLRGYSLHFNRQEEIQVSLDLEPLQPLAGIQPVLYLLDAAGEPRGATSDLQPALVWFPVEQWPVGQTVRIRFNTLPWYTRETDRYRLALGLVHGDDVWDISRRQRPIFTRPPEFAVRLPAAGTLVELARFEQTWNIPAGGPVNRQFGGARPPHPLQANFGNQVQLLGFALSRRLHPPGLVITLYWQALSQPQDLTRFVQLVGPDGLIYSQNDSAPDGGNYPSGLWQPGEFVSETISLPRPAGPPPGNYTLHVGLYDPESGQRLPVLSGGDHVEITDPFSKAK